MSKFIDFHTHKTYDDSQVVFVRSLMLKEAEHTKRDFYHTVGCHPWEAGNFAFYEEKLKKYCKSPMCLAIGEIGLDRARGDLAIQEKVFRAQLDLAQSLKLPVVIHCVRAYDVLLYWRKAYPEQKWILHGFSGGLGLAKQLINNNIYLSIGTGLLNTKSKISRDLGKLPLDYIFLETDTAEIHIKDIYFAAAQILKIEVEQLKDQIAQNFKHVFNVTME